jgi:hypothetical protein
LQDQLEQERRLREALEARMSAKREVERLRMSEILAYMQSLGAATGVTPPASLFSPPRPPPPGVTPPASLFSPPRPPPPPSDPFSTPASMDKF